MTDKTKRQRQAKVLRIFRAIHRKTGALLFIFFFIISITGLLLGWKKHSSDLLLSKTHQGTSTDLKEWMPINTLHENACRILRDSIAADLSIEVDRIDLRKNKGVVKFIFKDHYWGIQLDGATGELLHMEQRRSDFIENLHDGSIVDRYLGSGGGLFKLVYTSITGIALLIFTVTGFWLWYGPKRMRKRNIS